MKKYLVTLSLWLMILCCASAAFALPAYVYPGDDPVMAAAANYTAALGELYYREEGWVAIPAPVILKTENVDDAHIRLYGNFWVSNYGLTDKTLVAYSGGECPAVMELTKGENGWGGTGLTTAEDGDDYAESLTALAGGDEALAEAFFQSSYLTEDPAFTVRDTFVRDYVKASGLDVEAYMDDGWEAISIAEEK